MREIKFRAWDDKGKFWYPAETIKDFFNYLSEEFAIIADWFNKDAIILEQYTGLKDKNGKEIYEGDIVKVCDKHFSFVHMHPSGEWVLPQFLDKEDKPITSLLWHCDKEQVEVVGNIHENPELLEEEE